MISEGRFPRPARGRDGKTPATLQNAHACASQAAGLGAEEGPSGAASPLGSSSAGIQSNAGPARALHGAEKVGCSDRGSGVLDFPFPIWPREGGPLAGTSGRRIRRALVLGGKVLHHWRGEGRLPCPHSFTAPPQTASKSDGQTQSPRGRSHVGQRRRHGKGVTYFQGPFRNLPANPDV